MHVAGVIREIRDVLVKTFIRHYVIISFVRFAALYVAADSQSKCNTGREKGSDLEC